MFQDKIHQILPFMTGVLFLLTCLIVINPIRVAQASSLSVTFANKACPLNTQGAIFGTVLVSPTGTYSIIYNVTDLSNGQSWTDPFIAFGVSSMEFGSGSVRIKSASDIVVVTVTINGQSFLDYPCGRPNVLNFDDGRCNQEPWQSFAVYPDGKGGYIFYALYQGTGFYGLHVTEKDLDNNPDTGANHIIAQAQGVQLWRLKGGLLQAHRIGMDNKDYSFDITCSMAEDGD